LLQADLQLFIDDNVFQILIVIIDPTLPLIPACLMFLRRISITGIRIVQKHLQYATTSNYKLIQHACLPFNRLFNQTLKDSTSGTYMVNISCFNQPKVTLISFTEWTMLALILQEDPTVGLVSPERLIDAIKLITLAIAEANVNRDATAKAKNAQLRRALQCLSTYPRPSSNSVPLFELLLSHVNDFDEISTSQVYEFLSMHERKFAMHESVESACAEQSSAEIIGK